MRMLAPFLAVVALVAFPAMSPPPVDELVLGQTRCKSNTALCIGSKNQDVYVEGNLYVRSPDAGSITITAGSLTNPLATTISGAQTDTGTHSLVKTAVLDAGIALFNGETQFAGNFKCGSDAVCGTVALTSGTPSTATATVRTGASCVCWPVGTTAAIAAGGCAASVSATTATFTGPNTVTTTVRWMCFY